MAIKESVALRIQSLCKARGLTLNHLARLCEITPSTVYSLMDSSRKDVSITTLKKICDGLGITLAEFFDSPEFHFLDVEPK